MSPRCSTQPRPARRWIGSFRCLSGGLHWTPPRNVLRAAAPYIIVSTIDANDHRVDCERLLVPFGSDGSKVEQILASLQLTSVPGRIQRTKILNNFQIQADLLFYRRSEEIFHCELLCFRHSFHQALKGAAGPREGKDRPRGSPARDKGGRHAPGTQAAFQQIVTDASAPCLANHFGPGPRM
jgi:hypothetical protein